MTLQKKRGRLPVEQDKISAYVRENIISGRWPAGHKIPTHIELGKKFGVTTVTVQRTLSSLVSDGFLRVNMKGDRGTFVNETPPHIFNYALVFPSAQPEPNQNMFYTTLLDVSKGLQCELGITITPYYWIDGNPVRPDYIRLVNDIKKERLAGIIFASPIFLIEKTPVVLEGDIPRIIIGAEDKKSGIPGIGTNTSSFIEKSLDYLVSRNCSRIAFISARGQKGKFTEHLKLSFAGKGLAFVPHWHHFCHLEWTEAAVNIVRLLMSPRTETERPDAILVGNDNLIEPVCEGLKLAGVRVPGELELVSHCNFPRSSILPLPVKFIGYDIHGLMQRCIEMLKLQRSSGKTSRAKSIEACTDEEYARLRHK
ncbi:MAG TPA: hypothetical protein DET40_07655 [Lentisphaeria bacterium]|nr:MAG: hypothetical protein A2X45_06640 [Lentisphaerae bacterium GWF2_50_93]HCE43408.1 hypothetical protein [Lentisphaeria bacterium]